MTEDQVIQLYQQHGWNDINAIRGDIAGGNWQAKVNGWMGSSGGASGGTTGVSVPAFSFDMDAANKNAMAELTPYYEKILAMYGGDVALAKQRIDQDYERGLRVKTENTQWEQQGLTQDTAERARKFKIALGDIDQQMNQRGISQSGIATTEKARATADEAFQQNQIDRQQQALTTGLKQFTEGANVDYTRAMEEKGYMKPSTTATTGIYAPSQAGVTAPGAAYNISNYAAEPVQKETSIEEAKRTAAAEKAQNAYSRAYTQWATDAQRLAAG